MADLPALSALTWAPVYNTQALINSTGTHLSTVSITQGNSHSRGVRVVVDVTALPVAGASLVVTIEGYDPVTATYSTLLASAAITTVSTVVLKLFPAATAAANLTANDCLPASWRVKVVNGGTGGSTATVKIGASLLA